MPGTAGDGLSVEESVSQEILRKLRLASQADTKDDAGVVCEEVRFRLAASLLYVWHTLLLLLCLVSEHGSVVISIASHAKRLSGALLV